MKDFTILVAGLPLTVVPADTICKALLRFVDDAEDESWGNFIKIVGSDRGIYVQYEAMKIMVQPEKVVV